MALLFGFLLILLVALGSIGHVWLWAALGLLFWPLILIMGVLAIVVCVLAVSSLFP